MATENRTLLRRLADKPRELVESNDQLKEWLEKIERIDLDERPEHRRGL